MATITHAAPIVFQDINAFASSSGTPTFSTTGLRAGGGDAKMVCAAAGAQKRADVAHPAATRVVVESVYVQYTTASPAVNAGVLTIVNASGNVILIHRTTGQLRVDVGATAGTVSMTPPAINTWFRVDLRVTVSGGVTTADWWIDGVAQTSTSASQADADLTMTRFGIVTATTVTWEYMDNAGSRTSGDAPLGAYRTRLNDLDTVVGANHSLGAGTFQKTGAVAITSGDSTSHTELTEKPAASASYVAQTAIASTSYVEYPVLDTTESGSPSLVVAAIAYTGSAANAYTMEVRAHDGVSEGTDLTTGQLKTSTSLHPLAITMTSPPSGGAWTLAKYQALKFRFGFSTDATPNPRLYGLAVMGVFPIVSYPFPRRDTPRTNMLLRR